MPLLFTKTLAQDDSQKPPIFPRDKPIGDQQVKFAMHNDKTWKWSMAELPRLDSGYLVSQFSEKPIWIFYGVKPSENRSGAIRVKVTRHFRGILHDTVELWRGNGFFGSEPLFGGDKSKLNTFEEDVKRMPTLTSTRKVKSL